MEAVRMNNTNTLLIKGARVIDPSQELDCTQDILIENGKIALTQQNIYAENVKTIDANGLVAAPGLVDMHVHMRDPGQTHKEDILTGCAAAVAGGVTSVAVMPNTTPVADNPEVIQYILKKSAQTGVKVYPISAVTKGQKGEQLVDFEAMIKSGAIAFSDDGRPVENAAMMLHAMKAANALDKAIISHCEDMSLAAGGIINEGECSDILGEKGLSGAAEEVFVARDIALSAHYNLPVHLAHISTKGSVELIRAAKQRGIRITSETCPHYFCLDESLTLKRDADYRMNPPLRTKEDINAIISALKDGTIDCIATDHAPHTEQEKSNFLTAPNGVVGLETSLAAAITYLVKPEYLSLYEVIKKMTYKPARILGIRAGTLNAGEAADIVLFDPNQQWMVEPHKLHSKSINTPFKGMNLIGKVIYTITNGTIIYQNN
jgi:dihydroorotase